MRDGCLWTNRIAEWHWGASLLCWWCCLDAKLCRTLMWLHGLQPARLPCPWGSPGKNTGVGCHFFLQGIFPTKNQTHVSCTVRQILYYWYTREAQVYTGNDKFVKWSIPGIDFSSNIQPRWKHERHKCHYHPWRVTELMSRWHKGSFFFF